MFKISPTFYRDEGGSPAGTTAAAPAAPAAAPKAASADEIAAAVLKAVGDRTTRAETGVVKSMAEQYGMTEEALKAVLDKHKSEQAAKLPEAAQKQIDEANAKLAQYQLAAEIAKEGAALGLVDPELAAQLIKDGIKTNDKGELTGVKEALEKLKEGKPYLFGAKTGAMAQKIGGQSAGTLSAVEERFYAKNPNLRPK